MSCQHTIFILDHLRLQVTIVRSAADTLKHVDLMSTSGDA